MRATALLLIILFLCSCSMKDNDVFRSVFPNISLNDGYEKMMGLAPSIEGHEPEIIEMSMEGGIEDARLPGNTYSEDYKYYQRTYLWDLENKDLQCRATCWCIKENNELICAWIETLILQDSITRNETLRFFSPHSSKEEIIDAMKMDDGLSQLNLSYVKIIASDLSNEILELYRSGKRSSRYESRVFDYLDEHQGEGTFYLSSPIDRYVQMDETKVDKWRYDLNYLLYIDDLPVCLITTNVYEHENPRWSYQYYPVYDEKSFDVIASERFYLLNTSDAGLYVVNEDDYGTLAVPFFENEDLIEQIRGFDITLGNDEIQKSEVDLDLINKMDLNISINDYDYGAIDESDLTFISDYLKENAEEIADCQLIGPIPHYQYAFSSLNDIEVYDADQEMGISHFRLVKNGQTVAYLDYYRFEEEKEVQINYDLNESDGAGKDAYSYSVYLYPVGYIFSDEIINEHPEDFYYTPIDRMVADKIQHKLINEDMSFEIREIIS